MPTAKKPAPAGLGPDTQEGTPGGIQLELAALRADLRHAAGPGGSTVY
jgi:hypothetical protein